MATEKYEPLRDRGSERNASLRFIQRFSFVLFWVGKEGVTHDRRIGHTSKAVKAQPIPRRAQASPTAYVDKGMLLI